MAATPFRIVYDGDRYQYTITFVGAVIRRFRKGTTHRHVETIVDKMLLEWFAQ